MSDTSNYIFELSEIIAQEFLKIGDNQQGQFFYERGEEIWSKLEDFYKDEGCCKEDGDKECEKQFLLRSLPLISSVIQLNSSIRHFNEAIEQVEKIYSLEDKLFDQAMNLSYLVFAYAVDKGYVKFSKDTNIEVHYRIGVHKDREKVVSRDKLWGEMRSQVEELLTPKLSPKPQSGVPWYSLAKRYAKQVKNKHGDIEKILQEQPGREDDPKRIKEEILRSR